MRAMPTQPRFTSVELAAAERRLAQLAAVDEHRRSGRTARGRRHIRLRRGVPIPRLASAT